MSVLSHQSAINPNRNFWLANGTISTLNVTNLTVEQNASISSITTGGISTNTLGANSITATDAILDYISSLNISTGTLGAGGIEAQTLSTIHLYADIVNIDEATISSISTNAIELDGAYLNTAGGTELLLNGIPIATTANLSSISDWAIFPAISTIVPTNGSEDVGKPDLPFREGFFSTLYANNLAVSSINNITFGVSSIQVADAQFSSITAQAGFFSSISTGNINLSTVNGQAVISGSNWSFYPALSNPNINGFNINNINNAYMNNLITNTGRANNNFNVSNVSQPNAGVFLDYVGFANVQTDTDEYTAISGSLITSRNGGGTDQTQINGQKITCIAGAIDVTSIDGGDITTRNVTVGDIVTEQADVAIYGRYLTPGDNALYVSGGFTSEGGYAHGFSAGCAGIGTYPVSLMLNRIDLLPIGTQTYTTFGATAMVAGLGISINAGLGINIASGLVVDVLAQDVQLRANDAVIMDADDSISLTTGGTISMNANQIDMNTNILNQNVANFVFNDSNFTVNSSNANTLNASAVFTGTPLPPSTIGFYSTINLNSQIASVPGEIIMTAQKQLGLYENISTIGWIVQSNFSTTFSTGVSSLFSTVFSSFTSTFERSYSTLAFLQDFPIGQVAINVSSLLLQHADRIELDTKPFPIFTSLSPGISTIVSSLYTYEAITDGAKYSEIGQIIQTIVPEELFFSTFNLSTGVSTGTIVSTLLSSFYSTLTSVQSFTSSIFNQAYFDSNAFSTPALLVSTINQQQLPYGFGQFTGNTTQVVIGGSIPTPVKFDTTEIAYGTNLFNVSSIQVERSGVWRILASPEFATTSGGQRVVDLWLTKNGTAVERTNSQMTVANNGQLFTSAEFIVPANTNDEFGLAFQSTDGNMALTSYPGVGAVPSTPAIIFNITQLTS